MDEHRSREVTNYLTETLGLQLLFIMPSSKSGPFMDRILVDRKACNQEKIKQLWANHRKTVKQQAMLDFMEDIPQ